MAKTIDVAEFMLDELKKSNSLYQLDIVYDIEKEYGDEFVYENENGNMAISKKVLTAFKKLRKDYDVEWDKGEKAWLLN